MESEADVKEVNDAFLAHNASWFDEINELSDVPANMWMEHAGMVVILILSHFLPVICSLSLSPHLF